MNTNILTYRLIFKDKIECMIHLFESYVFSLNVLNKEYNKETVENIILNFEETLINCSKKYNIQIGKNIYENLILGAIELDNLILIFYEQDKTIKIADGYIDKNHNTYHVRINITKY